MSVKINDYSITSVINSIIELLKKKELFTELIFENKNINSKIKPVDQQYLKYEYTYFNNKISKNKMIILLNFDFDNQNIEIDLSNLFYTNKTKNNLLGDERIFYNFKFLLIKEADISEDSDILKYVSNPKDNNQQLSYIVKTYNNNDNNVTLTTNYYNENSKDLKIANLGLMYPITRKYITPTFEDPKNIPEIYKQFLEYMFYDGQLLKIVTKMEKDNIVDMTFVSSTLNDISVSKNKMENYQKDVLASLNRLGNTSINNPENKKNNVRSLVNDVINDVINSFIAKEKITVDKLYNIDDIISTLKKNDNSYKNWTLDIKNIGNLNITFNFDKNIMNKYVIIDISNITNINNFKYYMYINENYVRRLKLKSSSLINSGVKLLNETIKTTNIKIPASNINETDLIVTLEYTSDNIMLFSMQNNIKIEIGKYYPTEQMFIPLPNKNDIINRVIKYILHNVDYDLVEFMPYNNILAYIAPNYFQNIELSIIPDTPMETILKYYLIKIDTETQMVLEPLVNNKSENGEFISIRNSVITLDKNGKVVSLSAPSGGKISMDKNNIITIEFPENKTFNIEGFGNTNSNNMFNFKKINVLYVVILLLLIYLIYRILKK